MKTQTELLDLLRRKVRAPIEQHADEILDSFGDDNEALASFQRARADLDALIHRLEHREFHDITTQLESHSAELRSGIEDLKQTLSAEKTLARAARVFWRIVALAARIVALA